MSVGAMLRDRLASWLWLRIVEKHRSRLGRNLAPQYTRFHAECRRKYRFSGDDSVRPQVRAAATQCREIGFGVFRTASTADVAQSVMEDILEREQSGQSLWNKAGEFAPQDPYLVFPRLEELLRGDVGAFLSTVFGTHFKIWYNKLYRSPQMAKPPSGSQRWHSDSGPGTCVNLMVGLSDLTSENGAMECLSWKESLEIFRRERRDLQRIAFNQDCPVHDLRRDFYHALIEQEFAAAVSQPTGPSGTVVAFSNNIIHKGGYPASNSTRYVWLVHAYPSAAPPPLEQYRQSGLAKRGPYPRDPAEDF